MASSTSSWFFKCRLQERVLFDVSPDRTEAEEVIVDFCEFYFLVHGASRIDTTTVEARVPKTPAVLILFHCSTGLRSREVDFDKLKPHGQTLEATGNDFKIQFVAEDAAAFLSRYKQLEDKGLAAPFWDDNNDATKDTFHADRDKKSTAEYFGYYAELSQQQNMLTDFTRTSTYQYACTANPSDFVGKVVCDVGCGTGILCFFAARAGAKKVYGIDASGMADHARRLVEHNNLSDVITIIKGRVEDTELPEQVDLIISEPMGMALVNERMLETFVCARKWLKPTGKMFPTTSTLYCAPFVDEMLYYELNSRTSFWDSDSFFGVDMSVLKQTSRDQIFKQPVVDAFSPECLLDKPQEMEFDFMTLEEPDLDEVAMDVNFNSGDKPATIHGLSFWFDVLFDGSQEKVYLSTSPTSPVTHWYQTRCVFQKPVHLQPNQQLDCSVFMKANNLQSYDIRIMTKCDAIKRDTTEHYNLKDPYFRAYSSATTYSAPSTPQQLESYYGQAQQPPPPSS